MRFAHWFSLASLSFSTMIACSSAPIEEERSTESVGDATSSDASDASDASESDAPDVCTAISRPSVTPRDVSALDDRALAEAWYTSPADDAGVAATDITDGHRTSACRGYNIWGNTGTAGGRDGNCHNAANAGMGTDGGIVQCQGDSTLANPSYVDMGQYHTANWAYVQVGDTWYADFFSWSGDGAGGINRDRVRRVALPAGFDRTRPPNVQTPLFRDAAIFVCIGQFSATSGRALPRGVRVEEPGPNVCVDWFQYRNRCGSRTACETCCADRAGQWAVNTTTSKATYQTAFRDACITACGAAF